MPGGGGNQGNAYVDIIPDMSGFFRRIRQAINFNDITATIAVSIAPDSLTRMRDQINDILARPPPFTIRPILDPTRLDQMWRQWMAQHRNESFDVQANVKVDNKALNALKATLSGLGSSLKTVGVAGGLLGGAGLAIGAIGPAALAAAPALLGMAAAMSVVKLGADGIKEAFEQITPVVDELKSQVGQVFKDGLAPAVTQLGGALTNLTPQIKGVAGEMAATMSSVLNVFSSAGGQEAFTGIFEDIGGAIRNLTPGLTAMLTTFRDLAAAAGLDRLGTAFGSIFQSISDAFSKIDIHAITGIFADILTAVGPLLGSLIEIFNTLGVTLGPIIAQLLTGLAPVISSLAGPLQVAGKALGEGILQIFEALAPVLPVVVGALAELFAILAPIIADLVTALAPVLKAIAPLFVQIGQILADVIVTTFEQLAPMLPDLTRAFLDLVEALLPLLPPILDLATTLLPVLLPLIIKFADLLTTVLNIIVPLLVPALEKLADWADKLAEMFGTILGDQLEHARQAFVKVGEIVQAAPGWFSAAWDAVSNFASNATKAIGDWLGKIDEIPGMIGRAFSGAGTWLVQAGKDIIQGLWDGIQSMWSTFTGWFKDKLSDLIPGGGGGIVARILPGLRDGGEVPARARGGWLSAPGGPRADGGLFLGSNNEFVVNARAMAGPYGGLVEAINTNSLPRFADGGMAGGGETGKKLEWLEFLKSIGYRTPLDPDGTGKKLGSDFTQGLKDFNEAKSNIRGWAEAIINGGDIPGMEQTLRPFLGLGNPDSGAATPPAAGTTTSGTGANSGLTGSLSGLTGPGSVSNGVGDVIARALDFAANQSGKPYQYGGVGNPSWDCSGFMSGIYAVIRGLDPYTRWFTTESDFTGKNLGFNRGLGGSDGFSIGVHNGGGGKYSHMAGTLGGQSVESGSNGVLLGGKALNASASQLPTRYYLPIVKEALAGNVAAAKELANIEGAGAARWREMAIAAMKRQGFDASDPAQVDAMMRQIESESGGDAKALQKVIDANTGGNEAEGLLQVAKGTYSQYRDPDLVDDRTNGWSNMNAALRYYKARYGMDLTKMWGQGHGYDRGGTINGMGLFGKWTNKPEEVLNPSMTRDFHQMVPFMSDVAAALRSPSPIAGLDPDYGGSGVTVNNRFDSIQTNSWEQAQVGIDRTMRRVMRGTVLSGTQGGR